MAARIVVMPGSRRREALSRRVAQACAQAVREGGRGRALRRSGRLPRAALRRRPEAASGLPGGIVRLHGVLHASDGLLLVNPEYNGSSRPCSRTPFDWCSRPNPADAGAPAAGGLPGGRRWCGNLAGHNSVACGCCSTCATCSATSACRSFRNAESRWAEPAGGRRRRTPARCPPGRMLEGLREALVDWRGACAPGELQSVVPPGHRGGRASLSNRTAGRHDRATQTCSASSDRNPWRSASSTCSLSRCGGRSGRRARPGCCACISKRRPSSAGSVAQAGDVLRWGTFCRRAPTIRDISASPSRSRRKRHVVAIICAALEQTSRNRHGNRFFLRPAMAGSSGMLDE